jgi:zinc finger protein
MSGNVPGGFRKGGALITRSVGAPAGPSASAASGAERGRPEVVRGDSAFPGVVFDSSASGAEKDLMLFPQDCFNCSARGEVRMCSTDVPHFKEVILMSFACDECGWKNVEVKGGGAVPPHGSVSELRYEPGRPHSAADMRRDVIKGDTAAVELVELELSLEQGSLGGLYTTVEGLLVIVRDKLFDADPFAHADAGDSSAAAAAGTGASGGDGGGGGGGGSGGGGGPRARRMAEVLAELEAYARGEKAFTLRVRDPMANTYIYSPFADGLGGDGAGVGADPSLTVTMYTRTAEEDADLGLADMDAPEDVDGAAAAAAAAEAAEAAGR